MIVLNFAHPITEAQRAQIEALTGLGIERVVDVPTQIDNSVSLAPQIVALTDACDLPADAWQTAALLVNLPGLAPAAIALVAEIHGRRGSFPAIIRLRSMPAALGTQYDVAEIVNVQAVREAARMRRWEPPR